MLEVNDNTTLFEIPVEFELRKSAGRERRIVKGYASTENMDQDGEVILQHGIDFKPLIESGYLNYDHYGKCLKCGTLFDRGKCPDCGSVARVPMMIGIPTNAEIHDKGLWVEGELFNGSDAAGVNSEQARLADEMWAMGMMLQKSGKRALAYSVEGGVVERHGNKIVKSVIRGLAVTHKPVNPEATIEFFAKSHCCGKCRKDHPLYVPGHSCGSHKEQAERPPMSKGDKEDMNKAMSTESASPLMLQNLDRGMSGVLYGPAKCEHYDDSGRFADGIHGAIEHLQKCQSLTKQQSISFLRKAIHNAPHRPDLKALVNQAGLIRP